MKRLYEQDSDNDNKTWDNLELTSCLGSMKILDLVFGVGCMDDDLDFLQLG